MCDNLKRRPKRNFSENWLKDNRFKSWICKVEYDDSLFCCTICNKKMSCSLSHVLRHANSTCHKNNMKENTSLSNSNNVSSIKKISRRSKFQQKWLDIKQFKPWLCEVSHNENLSFCSFCNKSIVGGISQIIRHGKSKAHIKMSEQNNTETNETNDTDESELSKDNSLRNESYPLQNTFEERKKSAEIRYAALIAAKNIPYQTAEDILNFFQLIADDYDVMRSMNINGAKCKDVITNVLYPIEMNRIVNSIQKTKFSIFFDETFDILKNKWTIFFARYVDPETLDIQSQIVKFINIDEKNKSEEKLFKAFHEEMRKLNIPFLNIVALSCNNASAMTEKYSSFTKRLKETCKNLLIFSCPYYSIVLAVNDAYSNIPDYCTDFLQAIVNFINNSNQNLPTYKVFIECFKETNRKFLLSDDTEVSKRTWFSNYLYIKRLLESWDTIKLFLVDEAGKQPTDEKSGLQLLLEMEKFELKAYLLFLKNILNCFHLFNVFFQTPETKIHLLQLKSVELLTIICKYFLKEKFLQSLCNDIQFSQKENQKALDEVNLGSECEDYLEKLMEEGYKDRVRDVRENCLKFYVTVAEEIRKRLPINNNFLSKLKVFQAEIALDDPNREASFNDVSFIAQTFGGFDQDGLRKEWHTLYLDFRTAEKQNLSKLNFDDMWKQILQRQYSINNSKYPNLKSLLNAVRSLPNTNIEPEYFFLQNSLFHKI